MKRFLTAMAMIVPVAGAAWAAGGTPAPDLAPEDRASEAYNRGIGYRDDALEREREAAAAEGEARARKLAKAEKEWEKAARSYRNAIDLDPTLHQAHSDLGFALRKLGDLEASVAAYDRALELAPEYGEAIEYRAEAYLGLGRLDEVKDAYMDLFRRDRALADELLTAMQAWVEERAEDAGDLDATAVEEFSAWVAERARAAEQTADLGAGAAVNW